MPSVSPLLSTSALRPSDEEVSALRQYFQYFATAAIAAEIGGPAWSFGFPRLDGSGFIDKLSEIWAVLKDGRVQRNPSAPTDPKDDQVDVFAWREQRDGLPGFLLIADQVATGRNWKAKSIKSHVAKAFGQRWFEPTPVTEMVAYHVIPFARPDDQFRDDVLTLGNVLHRLRVPRRVSEAEQLAQSGVTIEAFDRLEQVAQWVRDYLGSGPIKVYHRAVRIQVPPFLRRSIMSEHPFWLSNEPFARLEPLLPNKVRGVPMAID